MEVSFERQLACIERELKMRRRVYPRLVERGKMSQDKASEEILLIEAVIRTLRQLAETEKLL
jgi:hypothetical protein